MICWQLLWTFSSGDLVYPFTLQYSFNIKLSNCRSHQHLSNTTFKSLPPLQKPYFTTPFHFFWLLMTLWLLKNFMIFIIFIIFQPLKKFILLKLLITATHSSRRTIFLVDNDRSQQSSWSTMIAANNLPGRQWMIAANNLMNYEL